MKIRFCCHLAVVQSDKNITIYLWLFNCQWLDPKFLSSASFVRMSTFLCVTRELHCSILLQKVGWFLPGLDQSLSAMRPFALPSWLKSSWSQLYQRYAVSQSLASVFVSRKTQTRKTRISSSRPHTSLARCWSLPVQTPTSSF